MAGDLSGVYLRPTATASWTRLGLLDGITVQHIAAVAWQSPGTEVALCAGEYAVFRSANGGASWTEVTTGLPDSHYFSEIAWSPSSNAIVYLAGAPSFEDSVVTLFRSVDGGNSWTPIAHDLPSSRPLRVVKLLVHPTTASTLWLLSGDDGRAKSSGALNIHTLWKSVDSGTSWSRVDPVSDKAVRDVAIKATDGSRMLLTEADTTYAGSIWRSIDAGSHWNPASLATTGAVWFQGTSDAYCVNVGADPPCPNPPANHRSGRWKGTNDGETWTKVDDGCSWDVAWSDRPHVTGPTASGTGKTLSHDGQYWVTSQFVRRWNGTKYACASCGPDQWITKGIDNVTPIALADAEQNNTIYAGYYDLGIWRTQNGGISWQNINPDLGQWDAVGGNTVTIAADPAVGGKVWAAMADRSDGPYALYRSNDYGATWVQNTSLPAGTYLFGLSISTHSSPYDRNLYISVDGKVYRSTDGGVTWLPAGGLGGLPASGIHVTAVDPRDSMEVLAGGSKGLWRSIDGGSSWTQVGSWIFNYNDNPGSPTLKEVRWHGVHQIVFDRQNPHRVYVVVYVDAGAQHGKGLYKSANPLNRNNWIPLRYANLRRNLALDYVLNCVDSCKTLYLSSARKIGASNNVGFADVDGLERSEDGGATWVPIIDDPKIRYPVGFPVLASTLDATVYLGVVGYGVMRRQFDVRPVAVGDTIDVVQNSTGTTIEVLANDTDPDPGDSLSLVSLSLTGTVGTASVQGDGIAYTPGAGFAGVDRLSYTVRDRAGATASATVVVRVQAVVQIAVKVASASDDAEESASGGVSLSSSDLELTYDTSLQTVGLRFTQVDIPRGAEIREAHIDFTVDETYGDNCVLTIRGQASDNAATFATSSGNVSARPKSVQSISWSPPPWTVVGAIQQTPDLAPVIAEIVNRPGWASRNALGIILTGTGRRVAESYEGFAAGAAMLHVEYVKPWVVAVGVGPAPDFALHAVRPNPTHGALRVEFSLAPGQAATLELLDIAGRRVAVHEVGALGAGRHQLELRQGLPAGVYLVRLVQGTQARVMKAVVLR